MAITLIDRFLSKRQKEELASKPEAIYTSGEVVEEYVEDGSTALLYKWPLSETVNEAQHIERMVNDPVRFWTDVQGAWAGLKTDEEKNGYLETIRNWVSKHIHQYITPNINANYYPEMLDSLGLPLMGWVTENVLQDAVGHYWRMWFVTDPASFAKAVHTLADSMPTPETRAEYVNAIRAETEWYINDLATQGVLPPLLDLIPIDTMIFSTFELWPGHVGYGNMQWLLQKPESWIIKEIEAHKTIPAEDTDALWSHTEDVKNMIKAANFAADFIEKNISPSVRQEFLQTFYPEIARQIKAVDGIGAAQLAKYLGWGTLGLFGLFVVSKVVGGKKGSTTVYIPKPS